MPRRHNDDIAIHKSHQLMAVIQETRKGRSVFDSSSLDKRSELVPRAIVWTRYDEMGIRLFLNRTASFDKDIDGLNPMQPAQHQHHALAVQPTLRGDSD